MSRKSGSAELPIAPKPVDRGELIARVCEAIAGGMLVKDAVKKEGLRRETFWRWLAAAPTFQHQFAEARVAQAHALAEEAIDIADAPVRDHADAVRARTRVDVRKWFVAKLAPRIYGEKLQVEQEQRAEVRHVVLMPPRSGPPPAIIAGGSRDLGRSGMVEPAEVQVLRLSDGL